MLNNISFGVLNIIYQFLDSYSRYKWSFINKYFNSLNVYNTKFLCLNFLFNKNIFADHIKSYIRKLELHNFTMLDVEYINSIILYFNNNKINIKKIIFKEIIPDSKTKKNITLDLNIKLLNSFCYNNLESFSIILNPIDSCITQHEVQKFLNN